MLANYSLVQILVAIIVIAAVIAIVYAALREFGIAVPSFVVRIAWIVLAAALAIFAIRIVLSL